MYSLHTDLYTGGHKNGSLATVIQKKALQYSCNFAKCWLTFKILLL